MEELTEKDSELINISDKEKFIKNFKSMYYIMNVKQENITKIFPEAKIIEFDNICELNNLIVNKLKNHYNDAGFLMNITVSYSDKRSLAFGSWSEFKEHDWVESHCINDIVITWQANLSLPNYDVPQPHKIMVKLSDGMNAGEMLNLILSGNIEDIDETNINRNFFPIVARVDFIDPLLADEILNIIGEWVDGLKKTETAKSKFILKLQKYKRMVAYAVNYVIILFYIILSTEFFENTVKSYKLKSIGQMNNQQFIELLNLVLGIFILYVILEKLFESFGNLIFEKLKEYGETHIFNITKGDKNKQIDIIKEENENKASILMGLIITVLLNIICGMASTYLWNVVNK